MSIRTTPLIPLTTEFLNPDPFRVMNHQTPASSPSLQPFDPLSPEAFGFGVTYHSRVRAQTAEALRLGPGSEAWQMWANAHTRRHRRDSWQLHVEREEEEEAARESSDESSLSGESTFRSGRRSSASTSFLRDDSLYSHSSGARPRYPSPLRPTHTTASPSLPTLYSQSTLAPRSPSEARHRGINGHVASLFPSISTSEPRSYEGLPYTDTADRLTPINPLSFFHRSHRSEWYEEECEVEESEDGSDEETLSEPIPAAPPTRKLTAMQKLEMSAIGWNLYWGTKTYRFKMGVKAKAKRFKTRRDDHFTYNADRR